MRPVAVLWVLCCANKQQAAAVVKQCANFKFSKVSIAGRAKLSDEPCEWKLRTLRISTNKDRHTEYGQVASI